MIKTPLQSVTEQFGGKDKLVEKVATLIEKVGQKSDEAKDELRRRLQGVSNAKLVRLNQVLGEIESTWGSREKLVDAYLTMVRRSKDAGLRAKLIALAPARVLDLFRSVERRQRREKRAQKTA